MKRLVLVLAFLTSACVVDSQTQEPVAWTVCQQDEQDVQANWSTRFDGQDIQGDGATITETSSQSTDGQTKYELVATLHTSKDLDVTGTLKLEGTSRQHITRATLELNDTQGAVISTEPVSLTKVQLEDHRLVVSFISDQAYRTNAVGEVQLLSFVDFDLELKEVVFKGRCP